MGDRWCKGESLNAIGRHFGRSHTSIQNILSMTGGIRPTKRRHSRLALTLAEREEFSRGVVAGHSVRAIASSLGRAPSSVSREMRGNGGRRVYRASTADQAARDRAKRPKRCKLADNPASREGHADFCNTSVLQRIAGRGASYAVMPSTRQPPN
jgi:IS30 family transposase